ncbi:MAG: glutamate--tRNA ligase, partial [Candidatus Komeilibacteria bacterium]|nr:glutamate--tRNA ligase [Candidatus Komeilibacteria bacterium]
MAQKHKVRVRFAPSPTGAPHVGNIRTALFSWLFARHHNGTFILRIEDTDQARTVPGSLENIIESLKWLNLTVDEGPIFQSQRLDIYKKHALELVGNGHAYYCFCSEDRLKTLRAKQEAQKLPPKYDRHCLNLSANEIKQKLADGESNVIRLRVKSEGETTFADIIKGQVSFKNSLIDDQVLLKSDGFPTYHLAAVVDDHLMEISHVIRAEEWLPSTPKHIMLYDYFGWEKPIFAHVPVILGPDKSKLSKRHGAVSLFEYRAQGYLPEAMMNYLA